MAMLGVDIFGHFNPSGVVVGNKTSEGGKRQLTMWGMMIHYITA